MGKWVSSLAMNEYQTVMEVVEHANGPALTNIQSNVLVFGENRQDVRKKLAAVQRAFGNFQNRAVFCRDAIEPLFLSLFPPQKCLERPYDVLSDNVADLVSMETPLTGIARCDWGDRPVTVFPTLRGQPHIRFVGIRGPGIQTPVNRPWATRPL